MNDISELDEDLENAEQQQAFADESDETPPADIVAFNELRSCADLYRLHEAGQLEVQPEFQRDIVWPPSEQTRFIDSLAKQLPIPSMCISLDYKTDKRQVVDSLQRMSSIIRFLSEPNWRLSKLVDIDKRISNRTVEHIRREHSEIYSRVENTTIPVTVLRCDLSKRSHQEYLFTIFHRLNKGGLKLTNQEIRNCIYSGPFNNLLKNIVEDRLFHELFSIDPSKKYRYSNEELVLRIFAFARDHSKYKEPLSKYLNAYMSENRWITEGRADALHAIFLKSTTLIYRTILDGEPLPRLSKATIEAIFVAVIRNLESLGDVKPRALKQAYTALRKDPLFGVEALKEGLAATERVKERLDRAVALFDIK